MTGIVAALRSLAGDAFIAVGELLRGGSETLGEGWPDGYHVGGMESDGPDLTRPIPRDEVRAALDDLPNSELLGVAASLIADWKPRLPFAPRDADFLIDALHDRAAEFAAFEGDPDALTAYEAGYQAGRDNERADVHPVQLDDK